MNEQHPITPPPELVKEWISEVYGVACVMPGPASTVIADRAAQWGADQELKECVQRQALLYGNRAADELRAARRPKPLSLKEQALAELDLMTQRAYARNFAGFQADTIRRALELLSDNATH